MKKSVLLAFALLAIGALSAQTIIITYNANLGEGTLGAGAASEVYWHSGAGELGPWETVIGNWGIDDGVGLMTEISDDIWEITVDAAEYYGAADPPYAGPIPVPHIGMVYRNGDGTLEGKGYGGADIFAVYNEATSSYDVDCDCASAERVIPDNIINNTTLLSNLLVAPMPFTNNTHFNFTLETVNNVVISIYNMMGVEVAQVFNGTLAAGTHTAAFDASNLPSGNYIFRLSVGSEVAAGSIVKF
jgi:hypothetical protein